MTWTVLELFYSTQVEECYPHAQDAEPTNRTGLVLTVIGGEDGNIWRYATVRVFTGVIGVVVGCLFFEPAFHRMHCLNQTTPTIALFPNPEWGRVRRCSWMSGLREFECFTPKNIIRVQWALIRRAEAQPKSSFIWGTRRRVRELLLCAELLPSDRHCCTLLSIIKFGIVAVIVEAGLFVVRIVGNQTLEQVNETRNSGSLASTSESWYARTHPRELHRRFWTWDNAIHVGRLHLNSKDRIWLSRQIRMYIKCLESGSVALSARIRNDRWVLFHDIHSAASTNNEQWVSKWRWRSTTFCRRFVLCLCPCAYLLC